MIDYVLPKYRVVRDDSRCIRCGVCERQCSNEVHHYDEDLDLMLAEDRNCVDCQRCVLMCPTHALSIQYFDQVAAKSSNWTMSEMQQLYKQAQTGGVLLSSMGNPKNYPIYWDHLLLNASQVTNPSIDPLREPMEIRTILGSKPERLEIDEDDHRILTRMPPQAVLDIPVMFGAMSF
ncbi:MAG: 4Fe-4S dicluster domain-containing protein, partial [Coriobacteriales bacterium]